MANVGRTLQRRDHRIAHLAFPGLVHGHHGVFQLLALGLSGQGEFRGKRSALVVPVVVVHAPFPEYHLVGRHLATVGGLFPVEGNPTLALLLDPKVPGPARREPRPPGGNSQMQQAVSERLRQVFPVNRIRLGLLSSLEPSRLFRTRAGFLVVLQVCCQLLRPSKFEGHCPMIRHGCRMALMVALNWSVECVKEES